MESKSVTEARFYHAGDNSEVVCELCPHGCVIMPEKYGVCRVRENIDGKLVSRNYGLVTSLAVDPVEKKPLFHVAPGGMLLSVGSYGCNFQCEFCQNWQISQARPNCARLTPEDVVLTAAKKKLLDQRLVGIAYTYNEPVVGLEFVEDCANLAKDRGLLNVVVTNGYISQSALRKVLPLLDAFNIDIKAWDESFYRSLAHGNLEPVKRTIETLLREGRWVEVTYLVIPGRNDSDEDVRGLARWLGALNPSAPLHLSRYFPAYRSNDDVTPTETLERLREVARAELNYVYIGNVWKKGYADTTCPQCGEVLLERGGMELEATRLVDGACPVCHRGLEMIGEAMK